MSRITFKKCNRRYFWYGTLLLFTLTVTTHLLGNIWRDVDNQEKLDRIERAIKSSDNRQRCRIPDLPVHTAEIDQFLHHEPPLNCGGKSEDWVRCYLNECHAQAKKLAEHFQLHCTYTEIMRKTDYSIEEPGPSHAITFKSVSDHFELVNSDFARVRCKSSKTGERWTGIAVGVRRKLQRTSETSTTHSYNVLMFGFDSLSRNAFIRKLPKSYAYLVDKIGSKVLTGFNIIGDGTPQALIPILTGRTELELPETRKRKSESVSCDAYPMIWKMYEQAGYITAFNEDLPNVGTFTYRLNGFQEQPTDHYMRPYFLAAEPMNDQYGRLCAGDRPRHTLFMNYTSQILSSSSRVRKFIFSFHGELSHDSINLVEVADDDLLHFLEDLHAKHLHNTILIMMSDHGNRFATVRDTLQGKLEERLPFFSFAFPEDFRRRFQSHYANFVANANGRLVTAFDINLTLRHILGLEYSEKTPSAPNPSHPDRAISLFTPISANRSCSDAYIEPHWCSCLSWTELPHYDNHAITAATYVADHINRLTEAFRDICARLQVDSISWAAQLAPSDDLIRFRASSDRDGYLGSFDTGKSKVQLYQLKLTTRPGAAVYEASVRHDPETNEYRVETGHISRVNQYGDQARCIYSREPELRKFCYCT